MNPFEFNITVTEGDYRTAVYFNIFKKRKSILVLIAIILLMSGVSVALSLIIGLPIPKHMNYSIIATVVLIALLFAAAEYSIRRFLKTDKISINSERKVTVDDEGIFTAGGAENSSAKYRWDTIYMAYETKSHYFIYLNVHMMFIFPKRQMPQQKAEQLTQALSQKLGKSFYNRAK